MALTIETGAGIAGANSYCTLAEANAYAPLHMQGGTFLTKTDQEKEAILAQATRTIDTGVKWKGQRVRWDQALQWPRDNILVRSASGEEWLDNASVPQKVKDAVLEYAMQLAVGGDRTADQDSDGIKSLSIGKGAIAWEFDPKTRRKILGQMVPALLSELSDGNNFGGGMVRVERR